MKSVYTTIDWSYSMEIFVNCMVVAFCSPTFIILVCIYMG